MKAPLRFDQADVLVVADGELCLVGCGPHTNEAAIAQLLRKLAAKRADGGKGEKRPNRPEGDAVSSFFSSAAAPFRRVAVVRDLFDRDEVLRPHLSIAHDQHHSHGGAYRIPAQ